MSNNFIGDEEILYRCIFYGKNLYSFKEGKLVISSQAFADRGQKPSVDRASLCNQEPSSTQKTVQDGVISLTCIEVRMIDLAQKDSKGKEKFKYKIDVKSRPLPDNIAHAQIEPTPEYQTKSVFRKLRERLARIAEEREWVIPPQDLRK